MMGALKIGRVYGEDVASWSQSFLIIDQIQQEAHSAASAIVFSALEVSFAVMFISLVRS